jgi:hypothetical protein
LHPQNKRIVATSRQNAVVEKYFKYVLRSNKLKTITFVPLKFAAKIVFLRALIIKTQYDKTKDFPIWCFLHDFSAAVVRLCPKG